MEDHIEYTIRLNSDEFDIIVDLIDSKYFGDSTVEGAVMAGGCNQIVKQDEINE